MTPSRASRKRAVRGAALLLCLSLLPWPARAALGQDASGPLAAVEQLFRGMREAEPAMIREVLAADVRFAVLDDRGISVETLEGWLAAVGASGGRWEERIHDVEVRVDGAMASVWAPYTFYLDGEPSHCGVDSIELLRDAEGWKITQISDTRRTEGCGDPD
ncbi:MAG TPA: hypothetical protein VFQ22_04615 [Longimicrobiales bacterium]|nr:hypothetical protein [Longimicrobiales bacterium]